MKARARVRDLGIALFLLLLMAGAVQAAAPVIHAAVVAGDRLIIGGEFVLGPGRSNLASIDLRTGAIQADWLADTDGPVYALELSANGAQVFVGGDFSTVRTASRSNIAAINVATGTPSAWNPGADGAVRALARSANGRILYVGGDFSEIGGAPRARLASLDTQINTGNAMPWRPDADAPVRALALDEAAGRVYAGGDFAVVGGAIRNGLAALTMSSAAALDWAPLPAAGARVRSLRLGDGVLYAGGDFQLGGTDNLAALELQTGNLLPWNPAINGEVRALAWDAAGLRLYVGGAFTQAAGVTRSRIAAFRTDGNAFELMAWNPAGDSAIVSIEALLVDAGRGLLHLGGELTRVDGIDLDEPWTSLDIALPETGLDRAGGAYREAGMVELTCEPGAAACLQICYRSDGEFPEAPADCAAGPVSLPVANTTLRFFSEDVAGNRERLRTETYAVDNLAPGIEVSLPAGLYGAAADPRVELTCVDDQPEFGCSIHYTLDGTEPDANSPEYSGPISLAALFPDPTIPEDEFDPLLHLTGIVTLQALAIDGAGNAEPPLSRSYFIDLAPPQVSASVPSGNYVAPLTVSLTCNDGAGAGCADMVYRLDGALPELDDAGDPVAPARRYQGPLVLETGSSLSVLALDNAGNQSASIIAVYGLTAPEAQGKSGVGGCSPGEIVLLLVVGLLGIAARGRIGAA